MTSSELPPAYGGPGWRPRATSLVEELGSLWAACGVDSEWRPLRSVLLHRPGEELAGGFDDPEASLLLDTPDLSVARSQHDALARAYRDAGVEVHRVAPPSTPPPNQLFAADLFVMSPEGAILGRPASAVRAGEERWVARALAEIGVPILRAVGGRGTFEGADLMWLNARRALLATGLRTNENGAAQVALTLGELGVDVAITRLPPGTMHLMGQLRIVDRDLALGWPGRLPGDAVEALEEEGFRVRFIPDEEEALTSFGLNMVTLGPRRVLMPTGNPVCQRFYEEMGLECLTVEVGELGKAAGSVGCLTGVVEREAAGAA